MDAIERRRPQQAAARVTFEKDDVQAKGAGPLARDPEQPGRLVRAQTWANPRCASSSA
jgi:hypothetical protein